MVWLWSVGPSRTIGDSGSSNYEQRRGGDLSLRCQFVGNRASKPNWESFNCPKSPVAMFPKEWLEQGIRSLPINLSHSLRVYDLPSHHFDPFDRMIIAQAIVEQMIVLTSGRVFEKYPIELVWCGRLRSCAPPDSRGGCSTWLMQCKKVRSLSPFKFPIDLLSEA